MQSKAGTALVLVGGLLLLAALLLMGANRQESEQAGKQSQVLLTQMQTEPAAPTTDPAALAMPTTQVDGRDSVGVLTIPKMEIELPILAELDTPGLKIAPCRQYGSTRTGDLVIAAHNYRRHFGRLNTLEPGDEVIVTEVGGDVYRYQVDHVETLEAGDVDKVVNSDHDLVLYTCTYSRVSRVTAFCDLAEGPATE